MIQVHRLRGEPLFVNADFVESIEAIRGFRASVLVAAERLRETPRGHLSLVSDPPE